MAKRDTTSPWVVKITDLKKRLSHYLRRVQQGESILVAVRDRVVARIERVSADAGIPTSDSDWLDRLERRGIIRRGSGKLTRRWFAARPRVRADVVAAVISERREGR
jgi:prevent-host-death family protein